MTALEVLRYAHLPGVSLAEDSAISAASGELRRVPFDEWLGFVGRDVRKSESRYTEGAPVFYVDRDTLVLDDSGEFVLDLFELPLVARRLQLAMMLASGWPLPDPGQSTGYVLLPDEGRRFRVAGARDIEWMVYPATDTPLTIDASMRLDLVESTIERLDAAGQGNELARLFDVYPMVFDGQLSHAELITHAVMSLEDVLNPDGEGPLGEVFALRVELVADGSVDHPDARREFFGDYYRLRNRVLHGGNAAEALQRIDQELPEPGDAVRVAVEVLAATARLLLGMALDDPTVAPSERLVQMLETVERGAMSRSAAIELLDAVRYVP